MFRSKWMLHHCGTACRAIVQSNGRCCRAAQDSSALTTCPAVPGRHRRTMSTNVHSTSPGCAAFSVVTTTPTQSQQVSAISSGTVEQHVNRYCTEKPLGLFSDAALRLSDQFSGRNMPRSPSSAARRPKEIAYSRFCTCSRICSISSLNSIAVRETSATSDLEPRVLASRLSSCIRKSRRLPQAPPAVSTRSTSSR
jgi:hypothetical protein